MLAGMKTTYVFLIISQDHSGPQDLDNKVTLSSHSLFISWFIKWLLKKVGSEPYIEVTLNARHSSRCQAYLTCSASREKTPVQVRPTEAERRAHDQVGGRAGV